MTKGKFAIAGLCLILSFVVTIQFRSSASSVGRDATATARADQLQLALNREKDKNDELYNQLLKYKDDLRIFSDEAKVAGGYSSFLANKLESASVAAGMVAVRGPGITVTLIDSTQINNTGLDENLFIIHDEDLLRVLNELKAAGAEAISLNGERLVATSEIRCVGPTVSVNNTKYAAPFVIRAIGNSDILESALKMRQGVVDVLSEWGIDVDIKKEPEITIDAYMGNMDFKYASVVDDK